MDGKRLIKTIFLITLIFMFYVSGVSTSTNNQGASTAQEKNEGITRGVSHFPVNLEGYKPIPIPKPREPKVITQPNSRWISYNPLTGEEIIHDSPIQRKVIPDTGRIKGGKKPRVLGQSDERELGSIEENDLTRNFTSLSWISNPEDYPWCVNVKLIMTFPAGIYVGSGVLIDSMHVLTAGHCVYYAGIGGWATQIVVVPGYENGWCPYGDAYAVQLHTWTGWAVDENFDHDMGVIDLDRPIGALTGWHGYGYNNDPAFYTTNTFNNPGYPAASPYNGEYMYYWYGTYDYTESIAGIWYGNEVGIYSQAYGGQSGSGAYVIDSGNRYVFTVLSNGNSSLTNFPRIDSTKFYHIRDDFIGSDTPSSFDLIPLDVTTSPSGITAGSQLSSMSYAVHNYSSASWSGTVYVDTYLSTNDNISTSDTLIDSHYFTWSFGAKSSVRVNVTTPPTIPGSTSAGNYYVGVILDIADYNTGNNDSDGQDASPIQVNPGLATVTTNTVSSITTNSATCGGNVTSDGGAAVTSRGVCWSTSPNPTTANPKTVDGSGTGSFVSYITGLSSGTTYHVRAYATNSAGTSYGEDRTFTTLNPVTPPTVTTNSVSSITTDSATCGGNVTADGGAAVTSRGVCWSTSPNPTTANPKTVDGSGTGSFVSYITGLSSGTTYHVRAYATNSAGTSYGEDRTFTTLNPVTPPTVTTNSVSSITTDSATCGGNVTADGGAAVTSRGVCWSTSPNPTTANPKTVDGSGTGSFVSYITGLSSGTTYHVRAYATNSAGTSYGEDRAFTTLIPITLPTVATDLVSLITSNSALCGGDVTSDGGASVTSRGVCWSTLPDPTISDTKTIDGSGTGSFTSYMTGLTPDTSYHVRAYATNSAGTAYGIDREFTTTSLPPGDKVLLIDLDGNHNSSPVIQVAIEANGYSTEYSATVPPVIDPGSYPATFVCLGISPLNYVLNTSEGDVLKNYLDNGGKVYMESNDTWVNDLQTSVHPYFGIKPMADGAADTSNVLGISGTFTEGISFTYGGENNVMDQIDVADGVTDAYVIWDNQSPYYHNGVARDTGSYRTIGVSFEFAGIPSGQQTGVMEKYLTFLFTPAPSLTVNSPNGGENWELGTTQNITWEAVNLSDTVKITLWKDGVLLGTIAEDLNASSGSYPWIVGQYVGGTANAGTGYTMKIKEKGTTVTDTSDASFTILASPEITVTAPNGGENWILGTTQNITWDAVNLSDTIKITLWKDGILLGTIAEDIDASTGSYPWTVGQYVGGTAAAGSGYTVKIKEKGTTVSDDSDAPFTISASASINVTAPNGGENWAGGSIQNITWDASGLSANVKITLWKDGVLVGTIANDLPYSPGSYAWTVGQYDGGIATCGTGYAIKVKEIGTTVSDMSDGTFTITGITVTSPNGGENWQIGVTQNITWNSVGLSANVKITLWKDDVLIGTIVNDLPSSPGLYAWIAGQYEGGTASAGTGYTIKIKEIGTAVSDLSDNPFILTN